MRDFIRLSRYQSSGAFFSAPEPEQDFEPVEYLLEEDNEHELSKYYDM